jgi:hypothetical protein
MTGVMLFGVVEWKVLHVQLMGPRETGFNLKGTGLINGWDLIYLQLKLLMPFRRVM